VPGNIAIKVTDDRASRAHAAAARKVVAFGSICDAAEQRRVRFSIERRIAAAKVRLVRTVVDGRKGGTKLRPPVAGRAEVRKFASLDAKNE